MRILAYICWWLALGFAALWFGYAVPFLIVTLTLVGLIEFWRDRPWKD